MVPIAGHEGNWKLKSLGAQRVGIECRGDVVDGKPRVNAIWCHPRFVTQARDLFENCQLRQFVASHSQALRLCTATEFEIPVGPTFN